MRLTDVLRDQHLQLCTMLDEVVRLGIADEQGRARLQVARQAMLDHLNLEDSQLYPALRNHPATTALARRYVDEMQQLTPALLAFFDTHGEGRAEPRAFSRSLDELLAVLQQRIHREEGQLYPAFDAHCDTG